MPTSRVIARLRVSTPPAPDSTKTPRARMPPSRRRMTAITKNAHRHSWMRLNRSTERHSGPISARGSRAFWTIRARCLRKALRCERRVTILRASTVRSCRRMRATPSSNVSMWSSLMRTMPGREAWDTRTTSSACLLRNMVATTRWPKLRRRKMRLRGNSCRCIRATCPALWATISMAPSMLSTKVKRRLWRTRDYAWRACRRRSRNRSTILFAMGSTTYRLQR